MAVVVAVVTGINLVGVKQAAWTVNLFTLAKLAPLLVLVVLGLPAVSADVLATQTVAEPNWTRAILLLMFAYGGFEAPLIAAGEASDPRRDSGFALVLALVVVAGFYLLVQLVVVGVVPQVAGVKAPIAAAFARSHRSGRHLRRRRRGHGFDLRLRDRQHPAVAARSLLDGGARRAARGPGPRPPAVQDAPRRHPGLRGLVTLAVAWTGTFESTATLSAIVRLVTYGLTCAALLILRRKRPLEAPGFRLAGAHVIAPVAVAFCLWLLLSRSFAQAWALLLMMALGELVGFGRASRRARLGGV